MAGTRLRLDLDRVPLWRGNHVSVKQLAEDFAHYHYLPRLKSPEMLLAAINDGLCLTGMVGAKVTVTLEIEAEIPGGAPENVVRTVTENARTLKFKSQGFEEE